MNRLGEGEELMNLVQKLRWMGYMAGGVHIAGWASECSFTEERAGAVARMIGHLEQGKRALEW